MKITGSERHAFVCAETDHRRLLWFDPEGRLLRTRVPEGVCFDVWALPDGTVLYTHYGLGSDGITVTDAEDRVLFRYETENHGEIFGCQPLSNGNFLLGEVQGSYLTEVDRTGAVISRFQIPYTGARAHEALRMVRRTKNGYLAVQPGQQTISVLDLSGKMLRQYPTRANTFGAVLCPNGNLLYTHQTGAIELDPDGNIVWELTPEDVPEVNIRWLLGLQLLSNGNRVFCNWLGHDHHGEGIPFFEVTPDKELVWTCDCTDIAAEPAVLQILEEDPAAVCYTPLK